VSWLGHIRLSVKLGVSFALVLLVLVAVGVLSVSSLEASASRAREIDERLLPGIDTLTSISAVISEVRIGELRYLDARTEADQARYEKESRAHLARVGELVARFETLIDTPQTRAGWERFGTAWKLYQDVHARGFAAVRAGRAAEAAELLLVQSRDLRRQCTGELDKLADLNRVRARQSSDAASALYLRSRSIVLAAVMIAVLLGAAVAVIGSRDITRSVAATVAIFRRISAGDLETHIESTRRDELGELMAQLGQMQGMLRHRIESDARAAAANERIRQGLDCVSACVMVVNNGGEVIYLNPALAELFRESESEIRKSVPGFTAAGVLGSDIGRMQLDSGSNAATGAQRNATRARIVRCENVRYHLQHHSFGSG
jgi:methyl-accepting chemotaxis protein